MPGSDKPSVQQQFNAARRNVSNSITSVAKNFLSTGFGSAGGGLSSTARAVSYPGGGANAVSSTPISTTSSTSIVSSESASQNSIAPREVSPVFTQFLDCLYQLWVQYPTHFEFNPQLLSFLNTHVYSCQFGTFLFNCERERKTYFRRGGKSREVGLDKVT
ncbi:hypothetical protein HK097_000241, partial [Rhizophlyctis rosea]